MKVTGDFGTREKLIAFLLRKGFGYQTALKVVKSLNKSNKQYF
jgi:SOS response regulatory protein OraA/RecX